MAYVVKSWKVSNDPIDEQGNFVEIVGRKAGLIAWLFSLVGIDPTIRILVGPKWFEKNETSLSGPVTKLIPLRKVSSVYSSYFRPWLAALIIFVIFFNIGIQLGRFSRLSDWFTALALVVVLIGAVAALVFYFLNRPFTLYVREVGGGWPTGIRFKRSVIENVEVNHEKVQYACRVIKYLVEMENS